MHVVRPAIATNGRTWRNGHAVASRSWHVGRHRISRCRTGFEVEAGENPSGAAAKTLSQPHHQASHMSASVTTGPDPASMLQSNGIHIGSTYEE
jgi:hypothetical protein